MYCIDCGNKIQKDTKYCPHCGKPNAPSTDPSIEIKQTQPAKRTHPTAVVFFISLLTMALHIYFYSTAIFFDDKNNITAVFSFIYFILFVIFLGTLFKKPAQTVPSVEKKHRVGWKWAIAILFISLSSFYIFSSGSSGSINPVTATILIVVILLMISGFIWYFIYKNNFHSLANTAKYSVYHPKLTIFLTIASLILVFVIYSVFTKISNNYFLRMEQIIPVIQDSLSDAAAAKIMGDSLYKGKYVAGSSWVAVQTNSANAYAILDSFSVPYSLSNYKQAVLAWTGRISSSSQNTNTWSELPDQPENFILKASDSQVKELFKDSLTKIFELKDLGANAIERKDRETMRYIAAKLIVQKHWINGIQHAKNISLFSFKFTENVFAADPSVCLNQQQSCNSGCMGRDGDSLVNCLMSCKNQSMACIQGSYSQPPPSQDNPPVQEEPPQDAPEPPPEVPRANPTLYEYNPEPTTEIEIPTAIPTPYEYDPEPRDVCISWSRGIGPKICIVGPGSITSTTGEMVDAATNFSDGSNLTADQWNKYFDSLLPPGEPPPAEPQGGLGLSIGEPLFEIHVPLRVQKFYDDCAAKGGRTGNWSQSHNRLPTSESGYNCSYGQNDYCWDFLTYSGGRYMGGNPGSRCAESNLVPIGRYAPPIVNNPPPAQAQIVNLDGTYDVVSWSVNKECKNINRPNSFNVSGNIVYNMWGWGNGNPTINTSGAAKCEDNSCSYQFYGSGAKSYMTGKGLESVATCPKNSKCTKPCQFSITAKHR